MFIFKREHEQGRGRKRAPGSELSAEPDVGLELMNPAIITGAEVEYLTEPPWNPFSLYAHIKNVL